MRRAAGENCRLNGQPVRRRRSVHNLCGGARQVWLITRYRFGPCPRPSTHSGSSTDRSACRTRSATRVTPARVAAKSRNNMRRRLRRAVADRRWMFIGPNRQVVRENQKAIHWSTLKSPDPSRCEEVGKARSSRTHQSATADRSEQVCRNQVGPSLSSTPVASRRSPGRCGASSTVSTPETVRTFRTTKRRPPQRVKRMDNFGRPC